MAQAFSFMAGGTAVSQSSLKRKEQELHDSKNAVLWTRQDNGSCHSSSTR